MKKIVMLNDYDLYLTYSWGNFNHGICGHTFEVIDYFNLLTNHMNVAILLCEDITYDTFEAAITEKYIFTSKQVKYIMDNTIFLNRPILLKGTNILFVDGEVDIIKDNTQLFFNNVFMFACGNKNVIHSKYNVLLDQRVYQTDMGTHYVKKIDFKNIKIPEKHDNKTLIYATENCRLLSQDIVDTIADDMIIISNFSNFKETNNTINNVRPPINNIFERFNKFIYTPISKKFDCSSRFVAECKYLNIEVEYMVDYFDEDLGLYYRKYDIENDFKSLELTNDDFIIEYLKELI